MWALPLFCTALHKPLFQNPRSLLRPLAAQVASTDSPAAAADLENSDVSDDETSRAGGGRHQRRDGEREREREEQTSSSSNKSLARSLYLGACNPPSSSSTSLRCSDCISFCDEGRAGESIRATVRTLPPNGKVPSPHHRYCLSDACPPLT